MKELGLLDQVLNAGFLVPQPDEESFRNAFQLLIELEVYAAKQICANPDASDLGKLAEVAEIAEPKDNLQAGNFHRYLWQASKNPDMQLIGRLLTGRALVASGQMLRLAGPSLQAPEWHNKILAALQDADAELTEKLVREHGNDLLEKISQMMQNAD